MSEEKDGWVLASRIEWENNREWNYNHPEEFVARLQVGCLQRIAASLERLVELAEPVLKAQDPELVKNDQRNKRWEPCNDAESAWLVMVDENLQRLLVGRDKPSKAIRGKLESFLFGFGPRSPYQWKDDAPVSDLVLGDWCSGKRKALDDAALPAEMGKPGTKLHAAYAAWLNTSESAESSHGAGSDK